MARGEAEMSRFEGKLVVVTGTSRGLGRALVEAFRDEGARVVSASRTEGFDVGREVDVKRLFETVGEELDTLINNAGTFTPRKPLTEVTLPEWEESIRTNLTGVFLCMREALRLMVPRRRGLIINVASGVSNRAAPTWGPYAAAKWGVEGLTKLVAEEVKDDGIRVVSVNPTRTRTPMRAAAYPDEDPETVKTPEETARFFVAVAEGAIPFESGDLLTYHPDF